MKLLIIEQDSELVFSIANYLKRENYVCDFADSLKQAFDKLSQFEFDCIILDPNLPDGDGISLLNDLKAKQRVDGVIVISSNRELEEKIVCLRNGADDYLNIPFSLIELSARVYAIIRRRYFQNANVLKFKELEINFLGKFLMVNNIRIELTKKEFELLVYLVVNKNKILSKTNIANHLSGNHRKMYDSNSIAYAHVKNLKNKLQKAGCAQYIKTVYGMGYRWEE